MTPKMNTTMDLVMMNETMMTMSLELMKMMTKINIHDDDTQ